MAIGERLRVAVEAIDVAGRPTSASVGVACYPGDVDDPGQLLELADRALYGAKRGGRGMTRRFAVDLA